MFIIHQQTIQNSISCFGVGLHSGKQVELTLHPAEVDTGIVFHKKYQNQKTIHIIPAMYDRVSSTNLCTTITSEDGQHSISTVEHLMAALWGCGIDNVIIEVDSDEVPIMDGSSEYFVFMLESAGIVKQAKGKKIIEVLKKIEVVEGDSFAILSPAQDFSVSVEIDFVNKHIAKQQSTFQAENSSFKMDLSRARTFGLEEEVNYLKSKGLVQGGSLNNAIVVGKDGVLNKEGLRYDNEFVRHKILDSIGDLYLAGGHVKGSFQGYKSGHQINNKLLRTFFADKDAWRYVRLPIEQDMAI